MSNHKTLHIAGDVGFRRKVDRISTKLYDKPEDSLRSYFSTFGSIKLSIMTASNVFELMILHSTFVPNLTYLPHPNSGLKLADLIQSCFDWPQTVQIGNFFKSDFRTFWRRAPKCSEIWSEKSRIYPMWGQSWPIWGQSWPILGLNLVTQKYVLYQSEIMHNKASIHSNITYNLNLDNFKHIY